MQGKVKLEKPNGYSITIDWDELVIKPFKAGYFIEAISSADALIDKTTENLIKQVYNDFKSLDFIRELHNFRGRVNFDGSVILSILLDKNIITQEEYKEVSKFKKKRNLVLHTIEGEYSLIDDLLKVKDQNEFDEKARMEIEKLINEGLQIFKMLDEKRFKIKGKEDDYIPVLKALKDYKVEEIKNN